MRELTDNEIEQVDGAILPLIAFGLAVGSKLIATNLVGWAIGSASLIVATYQAADYLSQQ